MAKQKTTIDDLAALVQRGFSEADKKMYDKIDGFRAEVREEFKDVNGRLDAIEVEILDIKKKIDNVIYRHEFESLKDRVAYLEKLLTAKKSR